MKLLLLAFLLSQGEVKIIELIKSNRIKEAESEIRSLLKRGERGEKIDYLFFFLYSFEKHDSVIIYSNIFLSTYPKSEHRAEVLYMLAKSYEKINFLVRALESYIAILKYRDSPYFKEAETKALDLSKKLSLKELLRNINKLRDFEIYPDVLFIAYEKAKQEGDLRAQEEIIEVLKREFPEHKKTKEIAKIYTKKEKETEPIFRLKKSKDIFIYLPLSGPDSLLGQEFLKGFELSFKHQNYKVFDTRDDPLYTYKLLEDHFNYDYDFKILIGPLLSKSLYLALPYFAKKGDKVFIVPALSYIRACEYGENIITLSNSLYLEIKALIERFIVPNNINEICVLLPKTDEGESITSLLIDLLRNRGKTFYQFFSVDSLDFQNKIDQIINFFQDTSGPEVIVFPSGTEESLLSFSSQIVFKGLRSKILTTGKFTTEDFAIKSNRYVEERVIFASAGIWDNSVSEKFISEFKSKYGYYPSKIASIGYDIGSILNFALEKNITGSFYLLNFLKDLAYFKGSFKFYLFGKNIENVKFYKIKDKKFELLEF
ncbi:MAG: hypothetical protein ABDH49_07060 [Candidatus Hydrothermales bacterium]